MDEQLEILKGGTIEALNQLSENNLKAIIDRLKNYSDLYFKNNNSEKLFYQNKLKGGCLTQIMRFL
jgi:hypothetical protein